MAEQIATVVTKRESTVPYTLTAETPGVVSNVTLMALAPWKIVAIRTARAFLQTFAGAVTITNVTSIPAGISSLKLALFIAGVTAGVTALQNTAELLAKIDQSYPEFRG